MIEGQMAGAAAILADEAVAQEQVEAGEGGEFGRLHILPERDDAGQLHIERGRMHLPVVARDHIDPLKEDRLDRGLPRPDRERVIGQRGVVRVENKSRACRQIPRRVFIYAAERGRAVDQIGFEHLLVSSLMR